jgi:hypothetical protein
MGAQLVGHGLCSCDRVLCHGAGLRRRRKRRGGTAAAAAGGERPRAYCQSRQEADETNDPNGEADLHAHVFSIGTAAMGLDA